MGSRFTWFLLFMLSACAAASAGTGFDAYVGRPVSDLALQIGPPTGTSHGGDGTLVFEWNRFGPAGQRIGGSTPFDFELGIHLWFPSRCVLRVVAHPARSSPMPVATDWITDSWQFVGMGCI